MLTLRDVNAAVLDSLFKPGGTLSPQTAAERLQQENPNAKISAVVRRLLEDPNAPQHRY